MPLRRLLYLKPKMMQFMYLLMQCIFHRWSFVRPTMIVRQRQQIDLKSLNYNRFGTIEFWCRQIAD